MSSPSMTQSDGTSASANEASVGSEVQCADNQIARLAHRHLPCTSRAKSYAPWNKVSRPRQVDVENNVPSLTYNGRKQEIGIGRLAGDTWSTRALINLLVIQRCMKLGAAKLGDRILPRRGLVVANCFHHERERRTHAVGEHEDPAIQHSGRFVGVDQHRAR